MMKLAVALCCALFALPAVATPLSECLGYQPEDKVLIVNADDVGMHPALDAAAFKLIDKGLIQDISMMPPTPNFANAAAMAKARGMAVGVHLTLTNEWQDKQPWGAVLPKSAVPSLYNPKGYLWATVEELAQHAKPDEVHKELLAQIAKVKAAGLTISHLDAHMIFPSGSPVLADLYFGLAAETGLPVLAQFGGLPYARQLQLTRDLQRGGILTPDTFTMLYDPAKRLPGQRYDGYDRVLAQLPPGINHLIIHPAEDSASARAAIADLNLRLADFAVWNGVQVQKLIQEKALKLSDFRPLLHAAQSPVGGKGKRCGQE
ncbi:hypothetical protein SAMN02745857_00302 [Andreprevotia lacus DSM 23236]|jgi:predicted glycoside hydrolase/deacetylase ChbG (UPF0249 family)|uniref:YdjC-like protein n=1 Tax=Andreprevotia lacus DSM 23236 TaxID=1121001 RepID=A0A1W1WZB6_9NEIS|nr:polysaccharide deacetylase family protein [Andreprevotia lacus]SMC16985.1 hypothetical protein SAMN02745857_00302 [Andreprevotia lacus DSM 23236]